VRGVARWSTAATLTASMRARIPRGEEYEHIELHRAELLSPPTWIIEYHLAQKKAKRLVTDNSTTWGVARWSGQT
jgi:hypothetical protein